MKHLPLAAFLIATLLLTSLPVAAQSDEDLLEQARLASEAWLSFMDHDAFADAWDTSGNQMREGVGQEEWVEQMTGIRQQLGRSTWRAPDQKRLQRDPENVPPGLYAFVQYRTDYENAPVEELVVLFLEPDDQWRVVGYWLR